MAGHRAASPDVQVQPALDADLFQRFHIALVNRFGFWKHFHCLVDAVFAQQVQYGIGSTIGAVGNVVHIRALKLKLRMKRGDLQNPPQIQLLDHGIRHFKKVIEVQKILQGMGQYQQCGVAFFCVGFGQGLKLAMQSLGNSLRIGRIADKFIHAEAARGAAGQPVVLEEKGWIDLPGLNFRITARPDRIDQMADGHLHIYDYKTGAPPTKDQQKYFEKQLLIEAAMAERGAFHDIGAHPVDAVTYIHLGGSAKDRATSRDEGAFDTGWAELQRLIRSYQQPEKGFAARRAMFESRDAGDYDHLARYGEWQVSDEPAPEDVGP